jgi:hypothetical protein
MKVFIKILSILVFCSCSGQSTENLDLIVKDYLISTYNVAGSNNYLDSNKLKLEEVLNIYKQGFLNETSIQVNDVKWPFSIIEINKLSQTETKETSNNPHWKKDDLDIALTLLSENITLKDVAKEVIKDQALIFQLSNVYFDSSKSKALFGVGITKGFNISEKYILVLVKKNEQWVVSNKVFDSTLH